LSELAWYEVFDQEETKRFIQDNPMTSGKTVSSPERKNFLFSAGIDTGIH